MDEVSPRQAGDADPNRLTRRMVLRAAAGGFGLFFVAQAGGTRWLTEAQATGGGAPRLMDPRSIPKFVTRMPVPPVMPQARADLTDNGAPIDYYEISVRQFRQQVLPAPLPATTVWGYGPADRALESFSSPSATIEAQAGRPVRVKWVNGLVDKQGRYRPHLFAVDPFLHWANPGAGSKGRDDYPPDGVDVPPYTGPVPVVIHLHGAINLGDESDGYAEAWYLPDAVDIPDGYARQGSWYSFFRRKAHGKFGQDWGRGFSVYQYPNAQRASTSWFHDHTLGLTRLNVYAGLTGLFILRGGPEGDDAVTDARTGEAAVLPGPAPGPGDPEDAPHFEIPISIQDRTFRPDGSLFYPDTRAFFDSITGPFQPATDLPPTWNPEFFGNTILANGVVWPTLPVEQRRYRFRLLNGCNARFLILDFSTIPGASVWKVGSEGGFLPAPIDITNGHGGRLLMSPADRSDVIVDFSSVPVGSHVLRNVGPDEPYGGGEPGRGFRSADRRTTGQVLQFQVVAASAPDPSTPPQFLRLPAIAPLDGGTTRRLSIIEEMSTDFADAPIAGILGTVSREGRWKGYDWGAPVSERTSTGATETWELFNTTQDAHPIHLHAVYFQVVDRQTIHLDENSQRATVRGRPRRPQDVDGGWKDTVIAYPGEVTRVRMRFGPSGRYMWHCHILEHEDNEMMRPIQIGPDQPGQPPEMPHPAPRDTRG
jgi:FtsP/CotA-like multicopper oxidase with cupredoxin domain